MRAVLDGARPTLSSRAFSFPPFSACFHATRVFSPSGIFQRTTGDCQVLSELGGLPCLSCLDSPFFGRLSANGKTFPTATILAIALGPLSCAATLGLEYSGRHILQTPLSRFDRPQVKWVFYSSPPHVVDCKTNKEDEAGHTMLTGALGRNTYRALQDDGGIGAASPPG